MLNEPRLSSILLLIEDSLLCRRSLVPNLTLT